MAVLTNSEEDELVVICSCGCDEGIHIKLDYDKDFDDYALMAFTNGNFYKEQGLSLIHILKSCQINVIGE